MITYIGKQVRLAKKKTMRELAHEANLSQGTISKWENGIHLPDLETLDMVAEALDCNPWNLIEYSKRKAQKNKGGARE